MKILQVGTESFHAKRRTDVTKLIAAFRNSANASKIYNLTVPLYVRNTLSITKVINRSKSELF